MLPSHALCRPGTDGRLPGWTVAEIAAYKPIGCPVHSGWLEHWDLACVD